MDQNTMNAYESGRTIGYGTQIGVATAADWAAYCKGLLGKPERGWAAEVADFERGVGAGYAGWKVEHPYSVTFWGSDPDAGNDDCDTGVDFATRDEALAAFLDPFPHVDAAYYRPEDTDWIEVDGPDLHDKRRNGAYRPRRASGVDHEWLCEIAMQAGMGLGVDGYNDAVGYGT